MPSNLGKAYVQIVPSAQGISGSISQVLGGESEAAGKKAGSTIATGIGGVLKTSAAVIGAGLAAAATGAMALVKSAVSNYADYEQLVGGVETLFKDSAGIVQDYAENAYKTAGLSANQYMETITGFSASLLQSLGGDTAEAARLGNVAVTDMADNANKMGTSMESIQNAYQGFAKQNYTMLDNLKLGYGGTKTEMERLIRDAEALDDSFSVMHTKTKSGIDEITYSYADVVQAIHIIQEDMGITGTTAEEASHTISGSIASMSAAWQNLITGVASGDQEISLLVGQFVTSVQTVAENIIPVIMTALNGLGTLIQALAPMLADMLPGLIESVLPPLLSAASTILSSLGTALIDNLPVLIDAALMIVNGFVGHLIENLPAFLEGAAQLVEGLVQGLIAAIPQLIPAAIQMALTLIDSFVNGIEGTVNLMVDAALAIGMALLDGLIEAIPRICEAAPKIITSVIEALNSRLPEIIQCGVSLFTALIQNLPLIIQTILTAVPQIVGELVLSFVQAAPQMWEAGKQLLVGLWEGIKGTMSWLWDKIKGFAREVVGHIKSSLGIRSPSTLMMEVGDYMMQGLGLGIEENASIVEDAMDGVVSLINGDMEETLDVSRMGAINTAAAIGSVAEMDYGGNDQEIRLLKEQNELLSRILAKTGVVINGKELKTAINQYDRAMGV